MTMTTKALARGALGLLAAGAVLTAGAAIGSDDGTRIHWGPYKVGDKRSGYTYAGAQTRAMQDDDFQNPAFLWLERGADIWETAAGEAGKACADCHGEAEEALAGVATRYPIHDEARGKLMNIEQRINWCREEQMGAAPFKWESEDLLGITAFVKNQSKGMPVAVSIDGPARPFWEQGKAFYEQRRGQLDMACTHCHVDHAGTMIRAETLSQGQVNGFPTYRLKWQTLGSLHRRFRGCNKNIRAEPYAYGSDEYVNLELYTTWRSNGLPIETPSVRK
ncbi:sulfur oxidation c-type cytochrome SoxA [Roseospira visakhapatnamensis]|uniref:SoxAX cytochrome complex subunit A n=1 Tax=Roseospira visakhapatnamensis TaxID=390880 RepID=A0A7W6RD27_9PROT|nr:sulfur oxidation c-type cytochrome SoxA [Roseospira visakhapatnamensis]MBB4265708.1 sulfur-oxidizing protein SoxA [Roseospira visakhapatnamensis]